MKTLARIVLTFLILSAIIFLCIAFIKADINPFNWSQSLRFAFAFLAFVLGSLVSIPIYIESSDE